MTQEFYISVTPIRNDEYLVRTERVAPGVPLAEEQVRWPVDDWLQRASQLMDDPVNGLLRAESLSPLLQPIAASVGPAMVTDHASDVAQNLVSLGQQLYNGLFQGMIRDSWVIAQGVAQHRGEFLRLRLGLKGTRLHRLPWEVLHAIDRPLATGTDIVFSRYHSNFSVFNAPVMQKSGWEDVQPLKILMVLAAPQDQEMLELRQEALHLQDELQTVMRDGGQRSTAIQLTLLEQPDREHLTQALEQNHYQVLHYAGHSNLGVAGGNLYLVNRKTGLTETLSGDDLAGLLVNNGIRMAVFNSCRGVYGASSDPNTLTESGNLAEALVKRGIPAVLAMSDRIPDHVALNLSQLFYRNLKKGSPIDLCLSRARQGLVASYSSQQFYWALPILYLHPDFDGYLQTQDIDDRAPYLAGVMGQPEEISNHLEEAFDPDSIEYQDDLEELDLDRPETDSIPELMRGLLPPNDPILPAPPNEVLLPHDAQPPSNYISFPDDPGRSYQPGGGEASTFAASSANTPINVFQDLQRVLADMGKLTPELLASGRSVDNNPYDAQAHANLGWVLYQHGYPTEAIAAYHQALALNPRLAVTHDRLGLALYQQGNVSEAIAAYQRAIELDPGSLDAQQHLTIALQGRLPGAEVSSHAMAQPQPRGSVLYIPKRWVRWGAIGVAMLALGGFGFSSGWLPQAGAWLVEVGRQLGDRPLPADADPKDIAAQADRQIKGKDLVGFQKSVTMLLDRQAFSEAEALLPPALAAHPQEAELQFLMGRLIWQKGRSQPSEVQVDQAAEYWREAIKLKEEPRYLNALGFANYARQSWESAKWAWSRAMRQDLLQPPTSPNSASISSSQTLSNDALTANAGFALASLKLVGGKAADEQKILQTEAVKARDTVMLQAHDRFQPDALSRDWQWTTAMIQDWRSLLAQKPAAPTSQASP